MKPALALLGLLFAAVPAFAGARFIVPVWGDRVQGWSGEYSSTLVLTNLSDETATVRVVDIVPIETTGCAACADSAWELPPHFTRVVSDQGSSGITFGGKALRLGGVVLESDKPVSVESEVFKGRWNAVSDWQSVDVGSGWLFGTSTIPRAIPTDDERTFSLYLLNPNDFPIRVKYWSDYGGAGAADVPAHRSVAVVLPASFNCPRGCGGAELPSGFAFSLHLSSDFSYLAAASGRSAAAPPKVHIAR